MWLIDTLEEMRGRALDALDRCGLSADVRESDVERGFVGPVLEAQPAVYAASHRITREQAREGFGWQQVAVDGRQVRTDRGPLTSELLQHASDTP